MVGSRWRVESITEAGERANIDPGRVPTVGFTSDGYVEGNDSVNGFQCRFRLSGSRYVAGDAIIGAVGYSTDGPHARAITAVDELCGQTVQVRARRGRLVLTTGQATLTLLRIGRQRSVASEQTAATPSATAS